MQTKLCFHYGYSISFQDALSAELNNLGINYGKELLEKPAVASNEQKNSSSQTFVDREQFLK